MGARSSEHIVAQTTTPFNLSLTGFSISPLRRAFPYLLGCVSGKETRLFEFLGTQPRKGCLGVEVSETEMKLSFQDLESDWQVIRKGQYHRKITGVDHLVSLWLTPEQEVFENPENKLFIFGVPSLSMRVTSGEGLPQTLIVDLESIAHSIIVDNGQVFHNILDIK
jgi:hypothetical protein